MCGIVTLAYKPSLSTSAREYKDLSFTSQDFIQQLNLAWLMLVYPSCSPLLPFRLLNYHQEAYTPEFSWDACYLIVPTFCWNSHPPGRFSLYGHMPVHLFQNLQLRAEPCRYRKFLKVITLRSHLVSFFKRSFLSYSDKLFIVLYLTIPYRFLHILASEYSRWYLIPLHSGGFARSFRHKAFVDDLGLIESLYNASSSPDIPGRFQWIPSGTFQDDVIPCVYVYWQSGVRIFISRRTTRFGWYSSELVFYHKRRFPGRFHQIELTTCLSFLSNDHFRLHIWYTWW